MSINTYYSFIVFDIIKYKLLETEVIFITEVYDGGGVYNGWKRRI